MIEFTDEYDGDRIDPEDEIELNNDEFDMSGEDERADHNDDSWDGFDWGDEDDFDPDEEIPEDESEGGASKDDDDF